MGFKFLNQDQIPDEPAHNTREDFFQSVEYEFRQLVERNLQHTPAAIARERFMEMVNHVPQTPLSINNRPAVFLQLNRNRNTIDDNEWRFMIEQQRRNLIEHMWEQGMVLHTIVSQDIDGFTLRTEILF